MKRLFTLVLTGALALTAFGQQDLINKLDNYFRTYSPSGQLIRSAAHLKSININDSLQTIEICADNHLGEQTFTPESAERIYESIQRLLPDYCRSYQLSVKTGGWEVRDLVPTRFRQVDDASRVWGDIDYKGNPWVRNASLPYQISYGLQNRHLSLWASHGRYFSIRENQWQWQRPPLFTDHRRTLFNTDARKGWCHRLHTA